jgi:hypothetical protein
MTGGGWDRIAGAESPGVFGWAPPPGFVAALSDVLDGDPREEDSA